MFSDLLYKLNRDPLGESGTLAGSYSAFYTPPDGTGSATINWDGGDFADATYLLIKDGTEGSYVWDISGWDGKEQILVQDVFGQHGDSHVEFFGTRVPGTAVPEPSTYIAGALLLLPFGVSVLRRVRKVQVV